MPKIASALSSQIGVAVRRRRPAGARRRAAATRTDAASRPRGRRRARARACARSPPAAPPTRRLAPSASAPCAAAVSATSQRGQRARQRGRHRLQAVQAVVGELLAAIEPRALERERALAPQRLQQLELGGAEGAAAADAERSQQLVPAEQRDAAGPPGRDRRRRCRGTPRGVRRDRPPLAGGGRRRRQGATAAASCAEFQQPVGVAPVADHPQPLVLEREHHPAGAVERAHPVLGRPARPAPASPPRKRPT